ncbi:MAG TPA: orotidine-5'-phosphate decarboxylase [Acidimicrobiia bacterium]|nr:orotidine-5'-phosphate decarboxylase [Acidimicrobiia bacterium]
MSAAPAPTPDPRDRLVLVLDLDSLPAARALARRLAPWFGTVKIGYELYAAAGPGAFDALHDDGFGVFADLKLYDIPTTVERAARAIGRHGVEFLNFHAVGGVPMLRAGIAGLTEGARDRGHEPPVALAVTVLTSEPDATLVGERLQIAHDAGCDGVVCAAAEAAAARALDLAPMVPGIRLTDSDTNDQARVATPADALRNGAAWLLLGRAVTAAPDPEAAAARVTHEAAAALQ